MWFGVSDVYGKAALWGCNYTFEVGILCEEVCFQTGTNSVTAPHVVWEIPELTEELKMFGSGFKGTFQG